MFTGIVQAVGTIDDRREAGAQARLRIACPVALASELATGASVAVAGVCLTAVALGEGWFEVDVSAETLSRIAPRRFRRGARVNLELPLRPADRLGGHIVLGHVDGTARLDAVSALGDERRLRFAHPPERDRWIVEKGSVALDGVSLTVAACGRGWLEVMLIPHTLAVTTLGELGPGDEVNVEYDILAKQVARLAEPYLGRD